MGIGRRLRRMVRRAFREVENVGRSVGDAVGSIPVVGDVLGSTGLVETPLQRQQDELERQERERQEQINKAERDREAEERWAKEQGKISQDIMGTQQKRIGNSSMGTDLTTVLSGDSSEDEDDLLKRMLKRK